jgi:hypothetical protein
MGISDLYSYRKSVATATGNRRDSSSSIPGTARVFFSHSVQPDSGAYPASYPLGVGGPSPVLSRQGCKTEY